ncbi:uracil-DNA glycosylase [Mucilaginibacter polytrichastri]|uniref:Uracil-DNA glycosylase n=1 Tax=Mucilaginibacter polytrichastri TaxID=1302689 RepID=A0A1Q5ZZP3_9SPHI|nr:uracil-DNA glycosylase [Mucilaginibacter polytrichastri]OKS87216.1 Uracil-DNA glycosylase [Mucilaginibacter polytrichastri]SFT19048.1 Uracil-DNA glycosylase [Mucilaginibacter polytrichastri]
MAIDLEPSWLEVLQNEFEKPYMVKLREFLKEEKQNGARIYPKNADIFNAFNKTPFNKVKVVILGQDPYPGDHQAHGLSFSVQKGIAIPKSLQNIYKELVTDIPGFTKPAHGNLEEWASQGVLLLNATLTVRAGESASHQKKGWEVFTDEVIRKLSEQKKGIVFILWGNYAQSKLSLIDQTKHHIIKSVHPSPLSVERGFYGSKPFSKANEYLVQEGETPIDWQIH